jgi:hypothetical protein
MYDRFKAFICVIGSHNFHTYMSVLISTAAAAAAG